MSMVTPKTQDALADQHRHPGELLAEELAATSMSVSALSRETGIPLVHLAEIVESRRAITPDVALGLATHFGTSARFWLNRQAAYERRRLRGALLQAELPSPTDRPHAN